MNETTPLSSNSKKTPAYSDDEFLSSISDNRERTTTVQSMIASGRYMLNEDDHSEEMLDQAIEGFEYDMTQNDIVIQERIDNAKNRSLCLELLRYVILFFIGAVTGTTAFIFDICIEHLAGWKFESVSYLLEIYPLYSSLSISGFVWIFFNMACVSVAAVLVVYLAPVAAGSGIPQIKCYLNGLNVPFVMRGITLFTKGFGVVLSVAGGLAVGKEGPMIHAGAGIAAGLSQGRLTWCGLSSRLFRTFRNDQEKRDFVSAGAAAGVSAAFGAPVGGLLFSLEEGTSFVNQRLTWQILFSSITSMFTLALWYSLYTGSPFKFTTTSLASFGSFDNMNTYSVAEVAVFILLGALGGVLGALFNKANIILTKFRKKHIHMKVAQVIEAALVSGLTAAVGFTMMTYVKNCRPLTDSLKDNSPQLKMFCSDSEYSSVSSLFFQTPEKSVRSLLHDAPDIYSVGTLFLFSGLYFFLACYTYGLFVPSGLFIPCLLLGAAWGRAFGVLLYMVNPATFPDPSKFALIGAAAQLGGIVRMTVSLTVILMEATGNIIVGLPILITLVTAKYVGDVFTEGIYDMHIDLNGWALLPWEPDALSVTKRAYEVMSTPVVYLSPVMQVNELVKTIGKDPHNAFPVVEGDKDPANHRYGTLVGLISRQHLALLIREKIFYEDPNQPISSHLTYDDFDETYPRFPKLKEVAQHLSEDEKQLYIDVRPYMVQAPYCVPENMTMNRVFNLFRLLGLRHLPVVDSANQVRGIITRKDLRRFRFEPRNGQIHIVEMMFSRRIH